MECIVCGANYTPRIKSSKYCSRPCYWKSLVGREHPRTGRFIPCEICGKEFYLKPCHLKERKYCSRKCYYQWRKGIRVSPETEFKKGRISERKGKPFPEMQNDRHPNWKGDDVGYGALHDWIRRNLGTPDTCGDCGKSGLTGKQIHWANKSGKYKRDITDWVRLCAKCHKKMDYLLQPRGEEHPNAKLNEKQVIEIKRLYKDSKLNQYELADKYHVSQATVSHILLDRIWKHIS